MEGQRLAGQHLLDGVVADRAVEAVFADRGDLAQAEGRVLGLQLDDRLADPQRQGAPIRCRRLLDVEQAAHARRGEAGGLAPEGELGGARLAGAGAHRLPEEHQRAQEFVGCLLGGGDEETQLLPVVGRLARWRCGGRHRPSHR